MNAELLCRPCSSKRGHPSFQPSFTVTLTLVSWSLTLHALALQPAALLLLLQHRAFLNNAFASSFHLRVKLRMARQRWSSENWRWLQPSFYLNRPGHLALIFLLFVCTSIVIWDRQTLLREHQETISNLEVDKEKLAQKLEEIERFLNDRKLHIGPLKQKDSKNGPLDPDAHLDVNELDLEDADPVARERRNKVKDAMHHAWHSYVKYAWGFDELLPQSTRGENSFGGLGATIVDSLDTLYIMGMHEEFQDAKKWVEENLDFNKHYDASVFETTIRVLGGLLSAYDLSNDSMFLKKAEDLAYRLLPAWNTGTGIPYTTINLASGIARNPSWTGGSSVLADLGTEQVELIGLSQRTGNPVYMEKAENVITQLRKNFPSDGLLGIYISPDTGRPTTSKVTFGAMGDSFYEYLLKVWILGNKTESVRHYREMWEQSMEGLTTLIKKTSPSSFSYIAERAGGSLLDKMDELACFAPGMLALGSEGSIPEKKTKYLNLAKELARTCYQFYQITPTKLAGENYYFTEGQDMSVGTAWNILRPETVESLMYLWRRTGDNTYRDWGWEIFQAFEAKCRLETGYAGLRDVRTGVKDDKMQSFFLAETLKYLYLLFSPSDVIPLDRWVFNTEAHPIKIITRREGISTPNSGGEASSQEVQNRRSGEVGHIRNVGLGRAGRLED